MRHVSAASFNGPLDLLLQLIERSEMDITQVSLGKVTEQYITELQQLEELPADELAEFLVVAAKLLLIKSRVMVPGQPVEDDAGFELERQLRMYKAFVDASKDIAKLYAKHKVSYGREGWTAIEPIFNPPADLKVTDLHDIYTTLLHQLEPIVKLPETIIIRTINIREKIATIRDQLQQGEPMTFHDMLRQASSRTEAIVTFLAVLELVKQRSVSVSQDKPHADMTITALAEESTEPMTITSL